jgi:hypothetical protein
VVAALYAAHALGNALTTEHNMAELTQTHPLSVVMREHIAGLREWALGRTVSCD